MCIIPYSFFLITIKSFKETNLSQLQSWVIWFWLANVPDYAIPLATVEHLLWHVQILRNPPCLWHPCQRISGVTLMNGHFMSIFSSFCPNWILRTHSYTKGISAASTLSLFVYSMTSNTCSYLFFNRLTPHSNNI